MLTPQPVDVQAIEAELTRIWTNMAESKKGSHVVLRACLLNLIVVAQNQQDADEATQVITRITEDHPCRAIVLFVDAEATDGHVDAWVTAHCQMPNEKSEQVCCEQIFVRVSGFQSTGIVAPLLVADLPVFVWWMGPLALGSPLSERLQSLADRWVFDGSTFDEWDPSILYRLSQSPSLAISDINWSRITPWREIIAQFFDPPHARSSLTQLSRVLIESEDSWQAWLMMGWLSSRLGWQSPKLNIQQTGTFTFHVQRAQDGDSSGHGDALQVTVTCSPSSKHGLTRLLLQTPCAQFEIERVAADAVSTRISIEGHEKLERNVMIRNLDLAQYICGELEILGHDKVFEEALRDSVNLFL